MLSAISCWYFFGDRQQEYFATPVVSLTCTTTNNSAIYSIPAAFGLKLFDANSRCCWDIKERKKAGRLLQDFKSFLDFFIG